MLEIGALAHLFRQHRNQIVDFSHPLHIHFHVVEKDAVQRVTGNVRQRWIFIQLVALGLFDSAVCGDADDHYPGCAQMQRGADWRNLAHRTVAKIFAVDQGCGENKRERR